MLQTGLCYKGVFSMLLLLFSRLLCSIVAIFRVAMSAGISPILQEMWNYISMNGKWILPAGVPTK